MLTTPKRLGADMLAPRSLPIASLEKTARHANARLEPMAVAKESQLHDVWWWSGRVEKV